MLIVYQHLWILFAVSLIHLIICPSISFTLDEGMPLLLLNYCNLVSPIHCWSPPLYFFTSKPFNTEYLFLPCWKRLSGPHCFRETWPVSAFLQQSVWCDFLPTALAESSGTAVTAFSPLTLFIAEVVSPSRSWFKILLSQGTFLYSLSQISLLYGLRIMCRFLADWLSLCNHASIWAIISLIFIFPTLFQ